MILLATNQQENNTPYTFKTTGRRVFSLEEAFFHCRAFWKQTVEDVFSPAFSAWVAGVLALPERAREIERLSERGGLRERLFGFLTVTGFYDEAELIDISDELAAWERRDNWEKLKDRADELCAAQPKRALDLYREALDSREVGQADNGVAPILNNAGVAAMALGRYDEAARYFSGGIKSSSSPTILLNYIEALINAKDFDKADEMIRFARAGSDRAELQYYLGEMEYRRGKYSLCVPYYEQAIAMSPKNTYYLRLADAYLKLRKFEKAIETAGKARPDTEGLLKAAEIHAVCLNAPAAVKSVNHALSNDAGNVKLLTALCEYSRADYDLDGAEAAITKALAIEPENPGANLELARLKKAQGKIKEYQSCLRKTLSLLKRAYREANS